MRMQNIKMRWQSPQKIRDVELANSSMRRMNCSCRKEQSVCIGFRKDMNLLVINGSPRKEKSSSLKLAKSFIEGMKKETDINIEEITINDMKLESCYGCFGCWWGHNPGKCVIEDDMRGSIEKLIWADVIMWVFPLYYYNVPGKMKIFIDRQLPTILPAMDPNAEYGAHPTRYDFSKQKHILISTCGFYTAKGNYDSITAMFDHMVGKGNYETVFTGEGGLFAAPAAAPLVNMYLAHVEKAGEEYMQNGITKDTREQLDKLIISREAYENSVQNS